MIIESIYVNIQCRKCWIIINTRKKWESLQFSFFFFFYIDAAFDTELLFFNNLIKMEQWMLSYVLFVMNTLYEIVIQLMYLYSKINIEKEYLFIFNFLIFPFSRFLGGQNVGGKKKIW